MDLEEISSFEAVKPYWDELNHTYKRDELAVDWAIHQQIWAQFYQPKGYSLKILANYEKNRCVGIFPFKYMTAPDQPSSQWAFGEEALISREYFCLPDKLHQFEPYLPPHPANDLSCFYVPAQPQGFSRYPGGIIDLKDSVESYLASLNKKKRHALTHNARENADVAVQIDRRIRDEEIRELTEKYLRYWQIKSALSETSKDVDSYEKIMIDFYLLRRAEEMGKLIAIYFYVEGQLAAVNFAIRRESDRVDDYLCLRDTDEKYAHRGLGNYAIWVNMNHCRQLGIRYYDLSDFPAEYKRKFINTEMFYYGFAKPEAAAGAAEDAGVADTAEVAQSNIYQKVG